MRSDPPLFPYSLLGEQTTKRWSATRHSFESSSIEFWVDIIELKAYSNSIELELYLLELYLLELYLLELEYIEFDRVSIEFR